MSNPNPPREGLAPPFKKGQSGNPGGKTSAQRKLEVQNAEKATRIRSALLDRLVKLVDEAEANGLEIMPEELHLSGDLLNLVKSSEDRGLGQPKSTAEIGGLDGGAVKVENVRRVIVDPRESE
jgi:hypothetical protein